MRNSLGASDLFTVLLPVKDRVAASGVYTCYIQESANVGSRKYSFTRPLVFL